MLLAHEDEDLILTAPCIRCGQVFASNPATVNTILVNIRTRCVLTPSGRVVSDNDPDSARLPACPPCARIFAEAVGERVPLHTLFPRARAGSFDLECTCTHGHLGHHRTPSGRRTWCTHATAAGSCGCKVFDPHPDIPTWAFTEGATL